LPVQAGDDELLRRMRRMYTVDEYLEKIAAARATVPALAVTTDIIAGFSGETEAEFLGTERLLRTVRFDVVHLQAYSVRPGTAAAGEEEAAQSSPRSPARHRSAAQPRPGRGADRDPGRIDD
jgi:tRNA-2-methylthio-N6-dimethylallyladenosine synthase